MALTNTDVFIVSDTGGTNYKLTYSDLLAKLQADGVGGGMSVLRGFANSGTTVTTGLGVDADKQAIQAYNVQTSSTGGNTRWVQVWGTGIADPFSGTVTINYNFSYPTVAPNVVTFSASAGNNVATSSSRIQIEYS